MPSRLFLLLLSVLCCTHLYAEDMVPGTILVARVIGDVYYQDNPDSEQKTLVQGTRLAQGNVVITKIDSRAILLFPSGSTLLIKPESRVHIEEYREEATPGATHLPEENTSKTQLRLLEGDIVGSVKKLSDTGSFDIHALAYTAGIRGTSWWMKLRVTERFEMTRIPKAGGGRVYRTTPLQPKVAWGFGVAEGSAMLTGPGIDGMPVGDETVVNVTGMLSPESTIEGAAMAPASMPAAQHEAIMGATDMMQTLMEDAN